jgi:hypothetical protein
MCFAHPACSYTGRCYFHRIGCLAETKMGNSLDLRLKLSQNFRIKKLKGLNTWALQVHQYPLSLLLNKLADKHFFP